jgi:trehalose 6-phosphate phosphatase
MTPLPPPPPDLLDGAALFLDFDGTLVELADTPDGVAIPTELGPMLERLRRKLDGRLAIISGRSLADLQRHLPLHGIAFSGSHGLELQLADGTRLPLSIPLGLDDACEAVGAFAAEAGNGYLVERKPAGIALHYRRAPADAGRAEAFMTKLARKTGLALQKGAMVIELRAHGATKGDALKAFMTEPAFAYARPVFVGDDLTDEDGFTEAAALGGTGVLVGPMRDTDARYRLESVKAVADWLRSAA